MVYTRRDLGKIALATIPMANAYAAVNSKFGGVQIGAITYSFRSMPNVDDIIKAMVQIGLGEAELMSNHAEALAGVPNQGGGRGGGGGGAGRAPGGPPAGGAPGAAPARGAPGAAPAGAAPGAGRAQGGGQGRGGGGGRAAQTPEQQAAARARAEELRKWRASTTPATWKAVRKKFNDAGIQVALLCYNMQDSMTDDDIEYGFQMAKGLGVKGMSTSTTLTMAKRIAPIADKHKLLVGYHGHDQTNDPNQTATLESYKTLMAYGKYNGINLDIGHFTASNYDAVAFIKEHHARITNLHLKDRKKDHGPNVPWGQGDTPIKDVLQLLKTQKYRFPANIEMEYTVPQGSDLVTEIAKSLKYCKDALA